MAPDTSSKITSRTYAKSSSFVMALLFTLLCGIAVVTMGYFSYYFAQGHFSTVTEEILDTEMKYLTMHSSLDEVPDREDRHYRLVRAENEYPSDLPTAAQFDDVDVVIFPHAAHKKTYAMKRYAYGDGDQLIVGVDVTQTHADFNFHVRHEYFEYRFDAVGYRL